MTGIKVVKTPFGAEYAMKTALLKVISEKVIAGTPIGNGNLVSGGVKLGLGSLVNVHPIANTALIIDGAEDLIQVLLSGQGLGGAFRGGVDQSTGGEIVY